MPQISVVVPVYKVEAYLDRCVSSILNQTFRDFDLYLVDDGSPDNCGYLCDIWARRDSRVHVVHQRNGGLSAARNAGIELALAESESQWITFIDSDDWVHPDMLQWLLNAAEEMGTDIGVCGYANTGGEDPWTEEPFRSELWKAEDFYPQRFIEATIACAKLYKKELFRTCRYPAGKLHEDEFVTYKLLFEAEQIAYVPIALYAYFVNPGSITKSAWSPRRLDAWDAYEQQIAFFESRKMTELVKFRYRGYLENAVENIAAAEQYPERYAKELRFMKKRMRMLLRRAWKAGEILFWMDYDLLYRFWPLLTKLYRFYLEKK